MTYTGEQLRQLTKVDTWHLRSCSICNSPLFYTHMTTDTPRFDMNCDCTSRWSQPQPTSWDEIADTVNRQSETVQEKMIAQLKDERP